MAGAETIATRSANQAKNTKVSAATWIEITDGWTVTVRAGNHIVNGKRVRVARDSAINVSPASLLQTRGEKVDSLPMYDANAAPWARGYRPAAVVTFETTACDLLVPDSFSISLVSPDATRLVRGKDYDLEPRWGTVGLLEGGRGSKLPVSIDYDCGLNRLDSIVANKKGAVSLRQGVPHNATPKPPRIEAGETVLANIWIPGRSLALTQENVYPIVEAEYSVEPKNGSVPVATELLPKTWAKIQSSETLKIIAWGDSVTDGGQTSTPAMVYQNQFLDIFRKRFPKSKAELTTFAWGGRNTDSFLNEPVGSTHNFNAGLIEKQPDLIIMEFVNDAYMTPEVVEAKYSILLKKFNEIGAEWIILTPHYVRPDWMGETSARVETDPRSYVAGVRAFCKLHKVALADASMKWGHLVKEGIPYTTLLCNSINHPNDQGHTMFAKSIMELFE